MAIAARLPGIVFEPQPRPPRAVLPRMDIAALVGFAASGPVDIPVAVEDAGRFRELFGEDLVLARDEERSEPITSQLGAAAETFFRNGGRRCWIVRVADPGIPRLRFPLTGLVPAGTPWVDPEHKPWLQADARSPGGWAESLTVEPLLQRQRLAASGFGPAGDGYELFLRRPPATLRPGDLLEINPGPDRPTLLLFVAAIQRLSQATRVSGREGYWYRPVTGSPDDGEAQAWALLDDAEGWRHYQQTAALSSPFVPAVYLLQFEIRAQRAGTEWRLANLAFREDHPRCWLHLPSDADLFGLHQGCRPPVFSPEQQAFRAEADSPRFPLAGSGQAPRATLPVGMAIAPGAPQGPLEPAVEGGAGKDGLDRFTADLFLDPYLKRTGTGALLAEAEQRYSLQQASLRGLHSLLAVEEITLIGIPDAGHRAWNKAPAPAADPLPAPVLDPVLARADASGDYPLQWSPVPGATAYRLQQDHSPAFTAPTSLIIEPDEGDRAADPLEPLVPSEVRITLADDCPRVHYFRVRALRHGTVSSWSQTRGQVLPAVDFDACRAMPIVELQLTAAPTGSPSLSERLLSWTTGQDTAGLALSYELEIAADADYLVLIEPLTTTATEAVVFLPVDGARFYRVRVRQGQVIGPWSNTVVLQPRARSAFTLVPAADYDHDDLLAIHRALIRFCAARGDLLACLSLPRHFRRGQVQDYLDNLLPGGTTGTGNVPALTEGEAGALSYAALYHPWTAWQPERSDSGFGVLYSPPEGFVLGKMARQALAEGAWRAPANRVLDGVLALDPALDREDRRMLAAAQVNLLQRDSRGFLVFNAETLATVAEYRQIDVRRLLILLRRLALREGRTYVFEPNDRDFRGLVRHRFERLLGDLYSQGAFTGSRPEAAFRVVVDESVNTRQSIEAGRFIVELRIAPAQPLAFLTIRLTQVGPGQLQVQEG